MNDKRKVLGRGISSLIPNIPPARPFPSEGASLAAPPPESGVQELPIAAIAANPRQPRRHFSEQALEDLAQSIRRCGVLQPLIVRRTDRGYELIAGERRLRASQRAGLERVPVLVRRGSSDREQLEIALIENLQREDLNPIEEAKGLDRLAREFELTQDEVAQRVGKERSTITNLLRLLKLSSAIQEMISSNTISQGHARALLSLEDARRQEALARRVEKEGLSVRQIEALVRQMLSGGTKSGRRGADLASKNTNLRHLSDEFQRSLGTRVEIVPKGKGGEIRIQYFAEEDLKRLSDRLLTKTP